MNVIKFSQVIRHVNVESYASVSTSFVSIRRVIFICFSLIYIYIFIRVFLSQIIFAAGKSFKKRSELNDEDYHKLGTEEEKTSTTNLPVC
jgi:hypothetical protein